MEPSVATSGLPDIMAYIFKRQPDINDRDNEGRTPLHLAVLANRYNYARELIVRGADIMVRAEDI
jgi:ankyrin repeat protein